MILDRKEYFFQTNLLWFAKCLNGFSPILWIRIHSFVDPWFRIRDISSLLASVAVSLDPKLKMLCLLRNLSFIQFVKKNSRIEKLIIKKNTLRRKELKNWWNEKLSSWIYKLCNFIQFFQNQFKDLVIVTVIVLV